MVRCYDHGTSYDTVRCRFTEISEPEWIPSDGRRCRNYYVLGDKTKRYRHAVRRVHTNYGSMHFPSAMNTTNDVNNEGNVDTTTQDMTNVTIRDRDATSTTTPPESRGQTPEPPVSTSVLTEAVESTPATMVQMMADIQEALKALPQLNQQLNHLTLQVQQGEERNRQQFEVYDKLFAATPEPSVDNGSMGSHDTPKEEPQNTEGAVPETEPLPLREKGSETTEGQSDPSPAVDTSHVQPFIKALGVKPVDRQTVKRENEVTTTGVTSSSEPPNDPGDDDDESVKSKGSNKKTKKSRSRKSLLPATTPDGGKDDKGTDLLVHATGITPPTSRKTKAFDFEKARSLGKEVHAQATDQRALPLDMAENISVLLVTDSQNLPVRRSWTVILDWSLNAIKSRSDVVGVSRSTTDVMTPERRVQSVPSVKKARIKRLVLPIHRNDLYSSGMAMKSRRRSSRINGSRQQNSSSKYKPEKQALTTISSTRCTHDLPE